MLIGEIIRQKIREDGRTAKEICDAVDMSRGNLDKIYHKDSLATDLLAKFCEVLKYDFFVHVNPYKYNSQNRDYSTGEPEHGYMSEALELRAVKDKLRALERELTFLDQSIADLKSNLRDKDEIISLQKDKIAMLEEALRQARLPKGK